MCKLKRYKTCNTRIDRCIKPLIEWLIQQGYHPISSCCGHEKYPLTVIIREKSNKILHREIFSGIIIPRRKRFYQRDEEGCYHLPELKRRFRKTRSS